MSSKNSNDGVWLGNTVTRKGGKPQKGAGVCRLVGLVVAWHASHRIRQGRVLEKARGCERKTGRGHHISAVTSVNQD